MSSGETEALPTHLQIQSLRLASEWEKAGPPSRAHTPAAHMPPHSLVLDVALGPLRGGTCLGAGECRDRCGQISWSDGAAGEPLEAVGTRQSRAPLGLCPQAASFPRLWLSGNGREVGGRVTAPGTGRDGTGRLGKAPGREGRGQSFR